MRLHKGQEFKTPKGKTVVVLSVLPFGRIDMGQMMDGPIPAGLSGIVRQWSTTQRSIRSLVDQGLYLPIAP